MLAAIFTAPGRFIDAWVAAVRASDDARRRGRLAGNCQTCGEALGPDDDGEEHTQCWLDRH